MCRDGHQSRTCRAIGALLLWVTMVIFATACAREPDATARNTEPSPDQVASHFCELFHAEDLNGLIAAFASEDYTLDALRRFRSRVAAELGAPECVLNERVVVGMSDRPIYYFERCERFTRIEQPIRTTMVFDSDGRIQQFSIQAMPPEAKTAFADYRTKTALRLPFDGAWYVADGGRSINLNAHASASDQRFAYDFCIQQDRSNYRNRGERNEDYYCFDEPILAPGAGVVTHVVDTEEDGPPATVGHGAGNMVVIDHENGEFSFLCHLRQGSIVVSEGEQVESGQHVGRCGNSGHSTGPHLHYHLQDSPMLHDGHGLPAQFISYSADGEPVEHGEPMWDQRVVNR